jgi:probable HAF family extracellular repeat protein
MRFERYLVVLLLLVAGCGGGGGSAPSEPGGRLTVVVAWPESGRLIPKATQSLSIVIRWVDDDTSFVAATRYVDRPSNQASVTTTKIELASGNRYELRVQAHPNLGGIGTPLAEQTMSGLEIQPGRDNSWPISLGSTIATIGIAPRLQDIEATYRTPVFCVAKDAKGNNLLLTPSNIKWSSGDPSALSLSPVPNSTAIEQNLTGLRLGVATFEVRDEESMVSSGPIPITIKPGFGSIQSLGTINGRSTSAKAVSGDGSVVVGTFTNAQNRLEGFRWTEATGMQSIGTLGGLRSEPSGISSDGSIIVGLATDAQGQVRAFRWTAATGMRTLGGASPGGLERATGISGDGRVIVGVMGDGHAFRWTEGTGMRRFIPREEDSGRAVPTGVSGDGSVVVGNFQDQSFPAGTFRWSESAGLEVITTGSGSAVTGVSGDGTALVGETSRSGRQEAFIWTRAGGVRPVDAFATPGSEAIAISADGKVILVRNGSDWLRWTAATRGQKIRQISLRAVSGDGSVVVGDDLLEYPQLRAHRWVKN